MASDRAKDYVHLIMADKANLSAEMDITVPKEGKGFKLIIISKQKQLNTYESLQFMNG